MIVVQFRLRFYKSRQITDVSDKPVLDEDSKTWIAIASGLSVGAQEALADLKTELLVEWLMGEGGGMGVSVSRGHSQKCELGLTGRTNLKVVV